MSQKVVVNKYGVMTALDTVPLETAPLETALQTGDFSERTSCIAFTFVVPENIIAESPLVPDDWAALIPEYYRSTIPSELSAKSKTEILALFDSLSTGNAPPAMQIDNITKLPLPAMLQCFTVPMNLYCTVGHHTILSSYSIRYNSRFASFPETHIPVNRNPRIDSAGILIVHSPDLLTFDPMDKSYTFDYLTVSNDGVSEIVIDEGYTYFTAVFTGNIDTTLSIDAAMGNGRPLPEQHRTQWYLEFDEKEMDNVKPSDMMQINEDFDVVDNILISKLYPSKNHAIKNCTAWIEVSDGFINEYYRPQGSALRELRLRFRYAGE
jgi:hypothetical protein